MVNDILAPMNHREIEYNAKKLSGCDIPDSFLCTWVSKENMSAKLTDIQHMSGEDKTSLLDCTDLCGGSNPLDYVDLYTANLRENRTALLKWLDEIGGRVFDEDLGSVAIIAQQQAEMAPALDPVMVSMLVNCQFWRTLVVPRCNNLMGCVASRLYLCLQGFPVFRYLPKMLILEKWRRGYYDEMVGVTYAQVMERVDDDMDWTLYYDTFMKLMLREIEATQRALTQRKRADDKAIEGIGNIPYLSHRQQDILRTAVLSPDTVFTISAHQKHYGTAYSTARADLEKLADEGYLLRRVKGAAYTYAAAPDLGALLAA